MPCMPVVLSLTMPFYPIQSAYDSRRLHTMENVARVEAYVAALRREVEAAAPDYADCQVEAIRVGGGIACHGADEPLGQLLRDLRGWFRVAPEAEVTLTAHPGMVSAETLLACRRGHVTTLSMDYVTADSFESEAMGRFLPPSAMDVTMLMLGGAPLALSFDIITGLPGQSPESLRQTLAKAQSYHAKEIVLHPLLVVPGSVFAAQTAAWAGSASPRKHLPDEKERAALWRFADEWLRQQGYQPTLPGRYALPGGASQYHRLLDKGTPLLGFGTGAVTRMDGVEAVNIDDLDAYIRYAPDPEKTVAQVRPLP